MKPEMLLPLCHEGRSSTIEGFALLGEPGQRKPVFRITGPQRRSFDRLKIFCVWWRSLHQRLFSLRPWTLGSRDPGAYTSPGRLLTRMMIFLPAKPSVVCLSSLGSGCLKAVNTLPCAEGKTPYPNRQVWAVIRCMKFSMLRHQGHFSLGGCVLGRATGLGEVQAEVHAP